MLTSGRINSGPNTCDKGIQSSRSSQARGFCQLPSEVQTLKGQVWYVWVSIRPGTCRLLLCSGRTPRPNCPINVSPLCWALLVQPSFSEPRICCLRVTGWMLTNTGAQLTALFYRPVAALRKHIHVNTTRTGRGAQIFLTMCHPAMFTLIASPQVNLPRLKTFTRAVYQRTTDGLKNRAGKKISICSKVLYFFHNF